MKVIAILNQKGGCGKTTTAVNLSHTLSKNGYKTLLIDADPQAHATFSLGIDQSKGICELIENYINGKELASLDDYTLPRDENFFIISSTLGLSTIEHKLANREDKLFILYKLLSQKYFLYDYCIIDCPPNLGILSLNAFFAAQLIIVPLTTCALALKGLGALNQVIHLIQENHPSPPQVYYLLTKFDKRYRYSLKFLEETKSLLGEKLLKTIIRTNVTLKEAASTGKTILEYNPNSRGAYDYKELAREIVNITQPMKWARFILEDRNFREVYVVGDFNHWQKDENYRMRKLDSRTWTINILLKKGTYRYKFLIDETWLSDPHNSLEEDNPFGGKNSVMHIV